MKIYKVMKFWANGWNEGHECVGTFSTREKAEREFVRLGLKYNPSGTYWPEAYTDHIKEVEIE